MSHMMPLMTAPRALDQAPLSREQLEAALRAIGAERYHNLHPFHKKLHSGQCTLDQVRAWALNRYCYQACIPRKDAAVMAKIEDRQIRQVWMQRILDHDGHGDDLGGIERWLVLTDTLGFDRDYVISQQGALPATRFAVEAYVRFVWDNPGLTAIASCLTELFAPKIHAERIAGMLEHYDFTNERVMAYFQKRLSQAPRDCDFALAYVLDHARTVEQQNAVINALTFKTNVLWAQLDALQFAYMEPGQVPPGAWVPGEGMVASSAGQGA
jgi:pyrroloquinoline-quinone synthase